MANWVGNICSVINIGIAILNFFVSSVMKDNGYAYLVVKQL